MTPYDNFLLGVARFIFDTEISLFVLLSLNFIAIVIILKLITNLCIICSFGNDLSAIPFFCVVIISSIKKLFCLSYKFFQLRFIYVAKIGT